MQVAAPAKVNIALRVGEKRLDGFHPLDTVFEALDLFDEITVASADNLTLIMEGNGAESLPVDETNLALRAARALRECSGEKRGAAIHIRKRIPIAGGMAGGSADAAGTLVALNELWGLGMTIHELLPVAATLGSDVPFCLLGGLARGRGRGEQLDSLVPASFHSWVFLTNSRGMSTPDVFRKFDELRADKMLGANSNGGVPIIGTASAPVIGTGPTHENASVAEPKNAPDTSVVPENEKERTAENDGQQAPASLDCLVEALEKGEEAAHMMKNDLTKAALSLRPDLREIMEEMEPYGTVILSGSGPTIAVLVEESSQVDTVAARAEKMFPHLGVIRAHGPAAGAHVVNAGENLPNTPSSLWDEVGRQALGKKEESRDLCANQLSHTIGDWASDGSFEDKRAEDKLAEKTQFSALADAGSRASSPPRTDAFHTGIEPISGSCTTTESRTDIKQNADKSNSQEEI